MTLQNSSTHIEQPESVKKVRQRFWLSFIIFMLLLLLGWCFAAHHFAIPAPDDGPLLGGSAGFTLLAIVIALSAYLRSVASDASKERAKIGEDILSWGNLSKELNDAYLDQMKRLNGKCEHMHVAAPFMMLLSLAISARLFSETLLRGGLLQSHKLAFRVADALIVFWVLLALITLCVLHHFAWQRDEKVRVRIVLAKEKAANAKPQAKAAGAE